MAGLHFDITGDNKNLKKALDETKGGIRSTAKEAEQAGLDMDAVFKKIAKEAAKLGITFSAVQLVKDIARVRGEFQQLEIALSTMLGSEEKANDLFNQLVNTAAKTPFDLQEVAGGAKQLLAFGVEAEKVNETIVRLGDVASGLSIPLGDLVYLYGTTMTQGRLFTQDLRQFQGRGIPLADELAKQFGVAKNEVGALVTAGKVGFPEVEKAIIAMTSEGGKFGGLMEKQSASISGQISNLEDAIDSMYNDIGKSTEDIISGALTVTTNMVENYKEIARVLGGVVAAYGSYKAVLMTISAVKNVQLKMEQEALAQILVGKKAEMDADLQSLVTKGMVTKETALSIQATRDEIKAKLQTAVATDRMAQAELAHATASYQNQQIQLSLSKLRLKQAQSELVLAQASGNSKRIENAQVAVNNALLQTNEQRRISSEMARRLELATTNANTTAQEREALAGQLENVTLGKMIKQKLALAAANLKVIATNPYFLAAAAVGALSFGIYKLVTAKSAEEKALERLNKRREESQKQREEEKNKIDELTGIINSEMQTRTAQVKAYDDLTKIIPEYTEGLTFEAFQAMSAAEQEKLLNEVLEKREYNKLQKDLATYESMLAEVEAAEGNWSKMSIETQNAIRNMFGAGLLKNKAKELSVFVADTKAKIDDYNEAVENAKPLDEKIKSAEKEEEKAKIILDRMKEFIDSQDPLTIPLELQFQYDQARREYEAAKATADALRGKQEVDQSENFLKDYNIKQKAYLDAKAALEKAEANKANYTVNQYKALVAELQKKKGEFEALGGDTSSKSTTDDRVKNQQRAAEQLLDIIKQNNRDRVELEKEGEELLREQIRLDFEDRMAEIEEQEKEMRELQGGKLTTEQVAAFADSRDIATRQRDNSLRDIDEKNENERKQALQNLLEDYLTYEQEREKIAKEYAEKRKMMQDAGVDQTNIDLLNEREAEALSAVDETLAQKSSTYRTWLNEIAELTLTELENALTLAENELSQLDQEGASEEQKGIARAQIATLRGKIQDVKEQGTLKPEKRATQEWRDFAESLEESASAFNDLGSAIGGVAGEILSTVGTVTSSTVSMINNIVQLVEISAQGTQQTATTAARAIKAVETASVILAIISAAVQIIRKIVELATKMHDGKYDAVIEANQKKVDKLEKSYEKLEEAVDNAFGQKAVQTLKQMNDNLAQQNALIRAQAEAEAEKKKAEEDTIQSYNEKIEENQKQIAENQKAMEEAIFGNDIKSAIEDFADAYADAVQDNMNLNESAAEQAKKAMRDMVQESIKEYVAGTGRMEKIRQKMKALYADGVFSEEDQKLIKAEYERLNKELDAKFAWAEDLLTDTESSSSEGSTGRGIATASQESVDENNGRLMSIQVSMDGITSQMVSVVTNLANITRVSVDTNGILSDIRSLHVQSNGFLEDIVKYTKPLNDNILSVVEQLKKL